MHFVMICTALTVACGIRILPLDLTTSWDRRYKRSLFLFLFPPLILLTTVLAILLMGAHGEMMGMEATKFSYGFSFAFFIILVANFFKLWIQAILSRERVAQYPEITLCQQNVRLIEPDFPYIAQIGWLKPELVASKGLIKLLSEPQLEAVLAHEQAHLHYYDNFCFFLLGWLRHSTFWLPNTETLWQELLLLREIRADLKAAETVDALTLAESLLAVAQAPFSAAHCWEIGFSLPLPDGRLAQRIDALIKNESLPNSPNLIYWSWLFLLFIPLATIPFHC